MVAEYDITEDDLRRVEHYLRLLQGSDAPALKDIGGGYYGTSALLHEVVELDILLEREPGLLKWNRHSARAFLNLNEDAHVAALVAEYTYLQCQIEQVLGEEVEIGALLWANTTMRDFDLLAESDWSGRLLVPDTAAVDRARRLLVRLREVDL
ncbi:MAG: hypothetical protein ISS49_08885 [Anaerolineae bacterium]|nr:hypothetical protein [Anaerolineae bacterium]